MPKKILILLYILCFVVILATISNHFDFDFGWHLRFGQEADAARAFPYFDTHTYTFAGTKWINHEWGNDLVVWQIYKYFGYWPLLFFVAAAILGAFIIAQKIFTPKILIQHLVIAVLLLGTIRHILVMRPAMYSLLFFAILWWTLERLPDKKTYYLWPPLIWFWSTLHGGWILAYVVIAIYITGHIINAITKKYWPVTYRAKGAWTLKTYIGVFFWSAIALVTVTINPYGLDVIKEAAQYLDPAYFKMHVTEWVPSYTYPIFWQAFLVAAPAFVLIFWGWRKKFISWPQLLLFIAFFYSGWQFKRNMMFFVLICQPILAAGADRMITSMKPFFKHVRVKPIEILFAQIFIISVIVILILIKATQIQLDVDIWKNRPLFTQYTSPIDAVAYLKLELPTNKNTKIFNEFVWGGYLIWEIPRALVFLDGRGTATWKLPGQSITAFEFYHQLVHNKPDGLKWIEDSGAEYILLQRSNVGFYPPDPINRFIFSDKDFKKTFDISPTKLELSLRDSKNWQLIYSDDVALIWKRLAAR